MRWRMIIPSNHAHVVKQKKYIPGTGREERGEQRKLVPNEPVATLIFSLPSFDVGKSERALSDSNEVCEKMYNILVTVRIWDRRNVFEPKKNIRYPGY